MMVDDDAGSKLKPSAKIRRNSADIKWMMSNTLETRINFAHGLFWKHERVNNQRFIIDPTRPAININEPR